MLKEEKFIMPLCTSVINNCGKPERSSTPESLDNIEQSWSNKAKCFILILQTLCAFMSTHREQHLIHLKELRQNKCLGMDGSDALKIVIKMG